MSESEFDEYRDNYVDVVEESIGFSGLKHSFFQHSKANQLRDFVAQKFAGKMPSLLDVGCGVGTLHPYIQPYFAEIHGVDVSSQSIEMAQANLPQNQYQGYDGERLPYPDDRFDMTLAVCVMHHVPKPQWENFLAEQKRVVRPGGYVCLIEHNPINPATQLSVARCPFDKDAILLGARDMRRRMKGAGLRDVASKHFLFFPSNAGFVAKLETTLGWLPLGAQYLAGGKV